MTIPIQPGPWSFLEGLGQAAGQYGQIKHDRQQEAIINAQRNSQILAQLIGAGILDNSAITGGPLAQAGMPGVTPQQVIPDVRTDVAQVRKRRIAGAAPGSAEEGMLTGTPTPGQVKGDEAAAANAEVTTQALQGLNLDQIHQLKGVLSPEAAALAKNVQAEKLRTELLSQDPQRLEANMQGAIRRDVLQRLPKDPQMRQIADYAAIGGLGYLISGLQANAHISGLNKQLNTEKLRIISTTMSNANTNFRAEYGKWQDGLQKALQMVALDHMGEDPDEIMKAKKEAEAQYLQTFPEPSFSDHLDAALNEGGVTKDEFQSAFKSLVHAPSTVQGGQKQSSSTTTRTKSPVGASQSPAYSRGLEGWQQGKYTEQDIRNSKSLSDSEKQLILATPKVK